MKAEQAATRALSRRSDRVGLLWLARHVAVVAVLAALVVVLWPGFWAWPAMAALGVVEMALFAPLHETTHRTPFRSPWLNRAVGVVLGLVLVLPPEWFRLFHLAHHRHTQDPVLDPEIAGGRPLSRLGYAWRLTGLPYWIAQLRTLAGWATGQAHAAYVPAARRAAVVAEARWYLAAYGVLAAGSVVAGSAWLVWLWMVPALLGQPVLRGFLMAEHGGLPHSPDRLVSTRTTLAGWAVRSLFWNANLHAEHHHSPGVPFHALPRLHAAMRPRLQSTARDYRQAHAQIRQALSRTVTAR